MLHSLYRLKYSINFEETRLPPILFSNGIQMFYNEMIPWTKKMSLWIAVWRLHFAKRNVLHICWDSYLKMLFIQLPNSPIHYYLYEHLPLWAFEVNFYSKYLPSKLIFLLFFFCVLFFKDAFFLLVFKLSLINTLKFLWSVNILLPVFHYIKHNMLNETNIYFC